MDLFSTKYLPPLFSFPVRIMVLLYSSWVWKGFVHGDHDQSEAGARERWRLGHASFQSTQPVPLKFDTTKGGQRSLGCSPVHPCITYTEDILRQVLLSYLIATTLATGWGTVWGSIYIPEPNRCYQSQRCGLVMTARSGEANASYETARLNHVNSTVCKDLSHERILQWRSRYTSSIETFIRGGLFLPTAAHSTTRISI